MKRLVSLILVFSVLFIVATMPAFAYHNTIEGDFLYEERFYRSIEGGLWSNNEQFTYCERYYHRVDENDPDSEIDWILVEGYCSMLLPYSVKQVVNNRVIINEMQRFPFNSGICIYDVKKDHFFEIIEEFTLQYPDFYEVLDELCIGYPIGDSNFDGVLSVMDAACIQRSLAQLEEFDSRDDLSAYDDLGGNLRYVSDANRDGVRDILDVSTIQYKLLLY